MNPYSPIETTDSPAHHPSRWDYNTSADLPADKSAGFYQAAPSGTFDKKQLTFQTESVFFSK